MTGLFKSITETICQINLPSDSISSIGNAHSSENCHYIVSKVKSALVCVRPKAKKQLVERVSCGTQNDHLYNMWCIHGTKSRGASRIILAWSPGSSDFFNSTSWEELGDEARIMQVGKFNCGSTKGIHCEFNMLTEDEFLEYHIR